MKLESFMAGEMVYPVIYVNITQGYREVSLYPCIQKPAIHCWHHTTTLTRP